MDDVATPEVILKEMEYSIQPDTFTEIVNDGSTGSAAIFSTSTVTKLHKSATEVVTTTSISDYADRTIKETNNNIDYRITAYYKNGLKKSYMDENGSSTRYFYDGLNRLRMQESDFCQINGATVSSIEISEYDLNNNLTAKLTSCNKPEEALKYNKISYGYNLLNQLVLVTTYNGTSPENYTQYFYDNDGRKTRMYTGLSSPLTITGLDAVTIAGDNEYSITKYEYNYLGKTTKVIDPLGQSETYDEYDLNGNVKKTMDRNKNVTTMSYDNLDRLTNKNVATPDGKGSITYSCVYNSLGTLDTKTYNGETVEYTYYKNGNLKTEKDNTTGIVKEYVYDDCANKKSLTIKKNGVTQLCTSFDYDASNRLWKVYDNGVLKATYAYMPNGNRRSIDYSNGVKTEYQYNLANRATAIINSKTASISRYDYSYYLDGNQSLKRDLSGKTVEYIYDGLGRLTSETYKNNNVLDTAKSYIFDDSNNIKTMTISGNGAATTTYNYDKNNRLLTEMKQTSTSNETTSYDYDSNGNTKVKVKEAITNTTPGAIEAIGISVIGQDDNASSRQVELYEYNGLDQLTMAQVGGQTALYKYDSNGLRIQKTINGVATNQIWEGDQIVLETDKDNNVRSKYTRGINLICAFDALNSKEKYYLYNGHGDVVQLADATGSVTKSYDYDAFGNEKSPDINDNNPFRYCGEYFDKETGSIYLRARYYDPEGGRFISEDSYEGKINDPLSLNLYTYCENNPVIKTDPSGHIPFIAIGALVGGAINVGIETFSQVKSGKFNFGNIIVAAASGAASGALLGSGYTIFVAVGGNAVISGTAHVISNSLNKTKTNLKGFATAVISGGVGGLAGGAGALNGLKIFYVDNIKFGFTSISKNIMGQIKTSMIVNSLKAANISIANYVIQTAHNK